MPLTTSPLLITAACPRSTLSLPLTMAAPRPTIAAPLRNPASPLHTSALLSHRPVWLRPSTVAQMMQGQSTDQALVTLLARSTRQASSTLGRGSRSATGKDKYPVATAVDAASSAVRPLRTLHRSPRPRRKAAAAAAKRLARPGAATRGLARRAAPAGRRAAKVAPGQRTASLADLRAVISRSPPG